MAFAQVISDLRRIFRSRLEGSGREGAGLAASDIDRWAGEIGATRNALYDCIGVYLARGFYAGELPFQFCDAVVNNLSGFIHTAHLRGEPLEGAPPLFWSVFLAFDAGEYYHDNNRNEDPVAVYTRPLIARIIEENTGFSPP